MALKHPVVVPSDDDLMSVGQRAKPLVEINDLDGRNAKGREISGMNQYFPVRHAQLGVLDVSVTYTNNTRDENKRQFPGLRNL